MNALTLTARLVALGLIPAEDFIGNGNDVAMTESGARKLDTYGRFYIHTLPDGEQVQQLLSVKWTLEEEITRAEKGALAMVTVSSKAAKIMIEHGGHEPVIEQIYSTKHLDQPGAVHPDSVLTSDVRKDGLVTELRHPDTTKAGTALARAMVRNPFDTIMERPKNLEDYQLGFNSVLGPVPKPDPTGRTSLVGNRFTGESERRPQGQPLNYLIDELAALLAFNNDGLILGYYREYLGTRDKPMFLRLRRAQQVRVAKRELVKMLAAKRKLRAQSIEKQFRLKPGTFGGL